MTDTISKALSFVPSHDRDIWLSMGMAIESELGAAGFGIWDEWSSQDATYNPRATKAVWKSIKSGGGIGIGTLFFEAQQHGFKFDGTNQRQAPDPAELAERQRQQQEAEAARQAKADQAAKQSAVIWAKAQQGAHAYCENKQIAPTPGRIQFAHDAECKGWFWTTNDDGELVELTGKLLLLPLYSIGGELRGLQAIDESGRKSLIKGLGKQGLFIPLTGGKLPADYTGKLYIEEGFATAATVRKSTGCPAVAAIDAGNLIHVAQAWRQKLPHAEIIIAGDLDKSGTGQKKANAAALAVGGMVALPPFTEEELAVAKPPSDWNDYAALHGASAVKQAIENLKVTSRVEPQPDTEKLPSNDPDAWPEPQSIPCSLLPVEAFDNELLPAALRPWVADIAERMQCPPDFPAVGAMVALSSVIGRKACIRPKRHDDWQVVPNLWGAIVGRPGVMKSPALSEVMKPLDRLAIIAGDLHDEVMRDHEIKSKLEGMTGKVAEAQAQKLVAKGNISGAEQLLMDAADAEGNAPPPLRRYKVTDASVEALGEILIENPWGTLAYRDELNGLLRSLDKEGQEGARAFYLQGYDGNQGYTFDRIMRGRNLHIPAVCIAMLGGIQPGKLQSYIHDAVSGGAGDDGLLQRFGLLVWPDVCGEWKNVDRWPDTPAKRTAFETFQRLDAMTPGIDPESGEEAPVVYRFSTDAQTLFEEWRQEFETALRSGEYHPAMESHLSKYRKLVPAVALVCALADGEAEVSRDSLLRSLAWSDYLQTHATRAYAAGTRPATEGATALLAKIKAGAVADGFKPADIYLKGWAHLATPENAHAAINMLCDLQHLRMSEKRPGSTGGRPSITFQINPATMGGE